VAPETAGLRCLSIPTVRKIVVCFTQCGLIKNRTRHQFLTRLLSCWMTSTTQLLAVEAARLLTSPQAKDRTPRRHTRPR
jgi:hypothetical protein